MVGMPMSGALAQNFGWETVFYVFGGLGTFWFLIWSFLIKGKCFIVETVKEEPRSIRETKEMSEESTSDGEYF